MSLIGPTSRWTGRSRGSSTGWSSSWSSSGCFRRLGSSARCRTSASA